MSFLEILEALSSIVSILGFPIAILVFLNEKRKERREREYGTYNALDEKYLYYLEMCMTHPELDMYWIPLKVRQDFTPEQTVARHALGEILISLMERAFLMYRDLSTETKRRQWDGWHSYIAEWAQRPDFRRMWDLLGEDFDADFVAYVNRVVAEAEEKETSTATE